MQQHFISFQVAVVAMPAADAFKLVICLHAGLGSLIQTAEMAWQQDDDLYSSTSHVLAAALEVHARIVNAGGAARAALPQQRILLTNDASTERCHHRALRRVAVQLVTHGRGHVLSWVPAQAVMRRCCRPASGCLSPCLPRRMAACGA
eukprot:GHRQ01032805.1.p1 GENE.GHRQ01032805.1~~GHRQ01032805.1.p1  ORF type:complete len:148 (-),score=39.37 GHRQ01032805.1:194-637(-)